MNDVRQPEPSLIGWTQAIYALHAFSLLTGILGAATVVGAFLTGWPSIIAVILNYVKRGEVRGTWLESHFRWQIRTFWFGLLWVALCVLFVVLTLGIGILVAWLPLARRALVHLPDRPRLDGAERPPADVRLGFRRWSWFLQTPCTTRLATSPVRSGSRTRRSGKPLKIGRTR